MSEILAIFHQSPPSYHQMHPHLQRDLVNVDSQFNWSIQSDFKCPEFVGFSSSSVDELSMVTAVTQSMRKRKLEFDVVKMDSHKQSVDCDSGLVGSPKASRTVPDENSKPKMEPEPDYVHVRARRGQATDSHSLAERARREKIKKKMQYLQDMVPGCKKLTNKAAILDEIITYVQCLQREVEFLTLKLAASTANVDFNMDNTLPEEFPAHIASFQQQ